MRFVTMAALGIAVWLTAPTAAAECSADTLQSVTNRLFAVGNTALKPENISAGVLEDAAACPNDAFVQKLASMAQVQLAIRTQANREVALEHAGEAFRLYLAMTASMPKTTSSRVVTDDKGARVPVTLNDSYDVMKSVLTTLLTLEAATGKRSKHTPAAPKAGDAPINCDVYTSSLAQEASFWIADKGDTPGAWNILNGIIANCKGNEHNRYSAMGYRANALLRRANANPAAPGAMDLIRRAYVDHEAVVAFQPEGIYGAWDKSRMDGLNLAAWGVATKQTITMPADQWFTAENIGKPLTIVMIASALDAAYGQAFKMGGDDGRLLKPYRDVIADGYARAKQLPEPQQRVARKMLSDAAKGHASGKWRRDENPSLKAPYDWLYLWVDPDYKPPATPAAPAAQ
jgi:hypothetical protein